MALAESPAASDPREALSRAFARAIGDAPTRPPKLGVEHEYGVVECGRQVDFGAQVDRDGLPGTPLHPTNTRAYQTDDGLLLLADGMVAEAATPPTLLEPGFAAALDAWSILGRERLEASLHLGQAMIGGSTHLSIEVDHRLNEAICAQYPARFSVGLMLLMDNAMSPGLLVRPRPNRTELCGEFVVGARLRAAVAYAAGSVLATQDHLVGQSGQPLPPAVHVAVEPARQRYGLYVDRSAFGPDLYADGRAATLHRMSGHRVSAQDQLEAGWRCARAALERRGVDASDLAAADAVVSGRLPLPCEVADLGDAADGAGYPGPVHRSSRRLHPPSRPDFEIDPVSGTWDFTAYSVRPRGGGDPAIVTIPDDRVERFLDELETGGLDDLLGGYLAAEPREGRVLASSDQTATPGVYDSVSPGPRLLPIDHLGIGPGELSSLREGKLDGYPPTTLGGSLGSVPDGTFPWRPIIILALIIAAIALLISLAGGGDGDDADAPPTDAAADADPDDDDDIGVSGDDDADAGQSDQTPADDVPESDPEPEPEEELCNGCDPVGDLGGSGGGSTVPADHPMFAVVEAARAGGDITFTGATYGSYVFTMTVAGDGQATAAAETTKWYNPRFYVNSDPAINQFDPGGFAVDVSIDADGITGNAWDETRTRYDDVVIEGEWLDSSTLQVTVTGIPEVELVRGRVELSIRIFDAEGVTVATFDDRATWEVG